MRRWRTAKGDTVEAAYKRGGALKRRQRLMHAWAEHSAGTWVGEMDETTDDALPAPMQVAEK
jgi:hypothetical protein